MRASILGLSILVATAAPALADDKAKAKALYEQGLKAYNLAEYQDAIKAWKDAYSLSKKPILLFNIGQAYRLDGDCKKAVTFYDSYQREEPNPKNQDELDAAAALCAKPADKPADKTIVKPADKPPVITRPPEKTPVADTSTTVASSSEEEPEPDREDEPEEPTGGGLRKVGIGFGVGGVVLGGAAIYFALDSGSAADDNDKYIGEWGQEQIDIEKRGERSAMLAWITGGVGVAAIAAGSVMFVIGGPKAAESSSVAIVPTRGGAAVGWSFRF